MSAMVPPMLTPMMVFFDTACLTEPSASEAGEDDPTVLVRVEDEGSAVTVSTPWEMVIPFETVTPAAIVETLGEMLCEKVPAVPNEDGGIDTAD